MAALSGTNSLRQMTQIYEVLLLHLVLFSAIGYRRKGALQDLNERLTLATVHCSACMPLAIVIGWASR